MRRPLLIAVLVAAHVAVAAPPWWDGGVLGQLMYRVPIEVTNSATPKDNFPITVEMNFTDILMDLGEVGALDEGSIRVIRAAVDSADAFGGSLAYLFERAPGFATISNARGWLSWITEGTLGAGEKLLYHVYFDIQEHGVRLGPVPLSWEAICYNPANKVQGGSFEPEASSVDQSRSPWRGWGGQGQPSAVSPQPAGHWGRWSLALVPGNPAVMEALIGLLEPGRSYLLGGYVRASSSTGDLGTLGMGFTLGGGRAIRFSKEQALAPMMGWWRSEVPLPISPDTSVFSITFDFNGTVPDTLWVDDLFIYEDPPLVSVGRGERLQ